MTNRTVSTLFVTIFILTILAAAFPTNTVQADGTTVPTLVYPYNKLNIQNTQYGSALSMPTFRWTAVDGATRYRLDIAPTCAFTSNVRTFKTANTAYIPNVADLPDGNWCWRVRREAPTAGDYSATFTFSKSWASQTTLLTPANGDTIESSKTLFSWTPVDGISDYRVEIAVDSQFQVTNYTFNVRSNSFIPNVIFENGIYNWRVIPVSGMTEGKPSNVAGFTQQYDAGVTILLPMNNAKTNTPTFMWTVMTEAKDYRIEITNLETYEWIVGETTATSFVPTQALPNGEYYWRVQGRSSNSGSSYAWVEGRFTLDYSYVPELSPSLSLGEYGIPNLIWNASYAPYTVEISANAAFSSILYSAQTSNNMHTPYGLPQGNYYWRIKNARGNYTAAEAMSVKFPVPSNLRVESQPDEPMTFCWDSAVVSYGMAVWKYRVALSYDPNFGSNSFGYETEGNCLTPTNPVDEGMVYWKVSVVDGYSNVGTAVEGAPFQKVNPTVKNLRYSSDYGMEFAWDAMQGVNGYIIEISTNPSFSASQMVMTNNNVYITDQLNPSQMYYWRVKAFGGQAGRNPAASYSDTANPQSIVLPEAPAPMDKFIYLPITIR